MEYLEDLNQGNPLLPSDPKKKAYCRLWTDHINRNIVPGFYRYLQAQEADKQAEFAGEMKEQIGKLVEAADSEGPFFLGKTLGFVDAQIAPWVVRMKRVLKPYRGWPEPEEGTRWKAWVDAIENDESVKATTSTDELYLDSYERYAGKLKAPTSSANVMAATRLANIVNLQKTDQTQVRLRMLSTRVEDCLEQSCHSISIVRIYCHLREMDIISVTENLSQLQPHRLQAALLEVRRSDERQGNGMHSPSNRLKLNIQLNLSSFVHAETVRFDSTFMTADGRAWILCPAALNAEAEFKTKQCKQIDIRQRSNRDERIR